MTTRARALLQESDRRSLLAPDGPQKSPPRTQEFMPARLARSHRSGRQRQRFVEGLSPTEAVLEMALKRPPQSRANRRSHALGYSRSE